MNQKRVIRDVFGDYSEAMEVISDMSDGDVTEFSGKTISKSVIDAKSCILVEKEGPLLPESGWMVE